eukprot:gene4705-3398_t
MMDPWIQFSIQDERLLWGHFQNSFFTRVRNSEIGTLSSTVSRMDLYYPHRQPGGPPKRGNTNNGLYGSQEANLAQEIRSRCAEVLRWTTSPSMSTSQKAAETVMKTFMLVYDYVQLIRQSSRIRVHGILDMVSTVIQQHLTENVEPIIWASLHDSNSNFMTFYEEQWGQFVVSIAHLRTIFLPGDLSWAELNASQYQQNSQQYGGYNKDSRSVELVALDFWKHRILHHAEPTTHQPLSVIGRLTTEVNDLLDCHRDLEEMTQIPSASESSDEEGKTRLNEKTALEAAVTTLRNDLCMLPGVHTTDFFMEEYLARMEAWHRIKCTAAAGLGVRHYMSEALRYLSQEQSRSKLCFYANHKVTQVLLKVILDCMPLNVTRSTLFTWMEAVGDGRGCEEELSGVFQLVSFEDSTGGFVGETFTEYAVRKIHNLVQETLPLFSPSAVAAVGDSPESVETFEHQCDEVLFSFLSAVWHLERIVTDAFQELPSMQEAIEMGLQKGAAAWRTSDLSGIVERLAVLVHLLVRRGGEGRSDGMEELNDQDDIGQEIAKRRRITKKDVVRLLYLFHTLGGKDVEFLEEHQRLLCMRLLLFFNPEPGPAETEAIAKQREIELQLLHFFFRVSNDTTVYRCGQMLASSVPYPHLIVENRSVPLEDLDSNGSPRLRVETRVVPGGTWLCPSGGQDSLKWVPLLMRETKRSVERLAHFYSGRRLELSGAYTTGVIAVRAPPLNDAEETSPCVFRLQLSLMQMCIVLSFNQQREWEVKDLLEAIQPGDLSVDFHAGLSALCAKGILCMDGSKSTVRADPRRWVELANRLGEKVSSCVLPEVMSHRSGGVEVQELPNRKSREGGHSQEGAITARAVRLLKQKGPLRLKEICQGLEQESTYERQGMGPPLSIETSVVKAVIEKLMERGIVQRDDELPGAFRFRDGSDSFHFLPIELSDLLRHVKRDPDLQFFSVTELSISCVCTSLHVLFFGLLNTKEKQNYEQIVLTVTTPEDFSQRDFLFCNHSSFKLCSLLQYCSETIFLVDVREEFEYRREHVKQACLFPTSAFDPIKVLEVAGKRDIYLMCAAGGRSNASAAKLEKIIRENPEKYSNKVFNVLGGLYSWKVAKLPIVEDRSAPLPIERQVHILAGALIIPGALLGRFYHRNFFLIPLGVGTSLFVISAAEFSWFVRVLGKLPFNNRYPRSFVYSVSALLARYHMFLSARRSPYGPQSKQQQDGHFTSYRYEPSHIRGGGGELYRGWKTHSGPPPHAAKILHRDEEGGTANKTKQRKIYEQLWIISIIMSPEVDLTVKLLVLISFLPSSSPFYSTPMPTDISVQDLHALIQKDKNLFLVDVREEGEYRREHVEQATLYPLSSLDPVKVFEAAGKRDLYVMCASGGRSATASKKLEEAAKGKSTKVFNVTGGMSSWRSANLPVVENKSAPLPIIRQVHIIASTLIISGSLLSRFYDPNFIALPIFVGCGLMVSGVTGFCGMALILNKLPYNK